MANFNPNRWYAVFLNGKTSQSLDGSVLYDNHVAGSVFFADLNSNQGEQRWQIFPYNATYYVLRTQSSGRFGYLMAKASTSENTPGGTVPHMRNASLADASMFWTIGPWGDGSFYLANAANGSAWHLNVKSSALMAMSSNITAPQPGQSYSFTQGDTIDNSAFSTVDVPTQLATSAASTSTSDPATTTSSSPNNGSTETAAPSNGGGLSPGAAAAIGASIGGVLLIAAIIAGIFLFRRRRRRANQQGHPDDATISQYSANTYGNSTYASPMTYASPLSEMAVPHKVIPMSPPMAKELPTDMRAAVELPGHDLSAHDPYRGASH